MSENTTTLVQLNNYPRDKYNVLIPVSTMQTASNLQKIIVNEVRLDLSVDQYGSGRDIYKEKSSGKFAITKVGGMKLAAAANISIVDIKHEPTDACKRCIEMAKAIGKAQPCGPCQCAGDLSVRVTIRVPEPSGGFRLITATREVTCENEKKNMSAAQYERFYPHRASITESKAFMRAIRSAIGLAATYTMDELKKPFIIAHVVPNLDAPEIREAAAMSYMHASGLLFETPQQPQISAGREEITSHEEIVDLEENDPQIATQEATEAEPESEPIPETTVTEYKCAECGKTINEKAYIYSTGKFKRPLCYAHQKGGKL